MTWRCCLLFAQFKSDDQSFLFAAIFVACGFAFVLFSFYVCLLYWWSRQLGRQARSKLGMVGYFAAVGGGAAALGLVPAFLGLPTLLASALCFSAWSLHVVPLTVGFLWGRHLEQTEQDELRADRAERWVLEVEMEQSLKGLD